MTYGDVGVAVSSYVMYGSRPSCHGLRNNNLACKEKQYDVTKEKKSSKSTSPSREDEPVSFKQGRRCSRECIERSTVRNHVQTMICSMEHLQKDITCVVADLKQLLQQIDVVTEKLDHVFGSKWRELCEKCEKSQDKMPPEDRSEGSIYALPLPMPCLAEPVKPKQSKLCRSPVRVQKPPELKIFRETSKKHTRLQTSQSYNLEEKLRTDQMRLHDISPDLDLSYLHISQGNHRFSRSRWGRSLLQTDSCQPTFQSRFLETRSISSPVPIESFQCKSSDSETSSPVTAIPMSQCYTQGRLSQMDLLPRSDTTDIGDVGATRRSKSPISVAYTSSDMTNSSSEVATNTNSLDDSIMAALDFLGNVLGQEKLDSSGSDIGYIAGDSFSPEEEDLVMDSLNGANTKLDMLNSKYVNVDSSSDHDNDVAEYDDLYENLMENQLENMSSSGCSEYTNTSDPNMELCSLEASDAEYSDDVRYDREINTWTSYTLAHMNSSMRSSDSCVSDTPSDIMNENTRATLTYGNMIFSDQLVLYSKKRDQNKQSLKSNME